MDCRKAIKMVPEYIQGELTDEEAEELLRHTNTCPQCREELEIYFSIYEGLKQLDDDEYDSENELSLDQMIRNTYQRLRASYLSKIWLYSVNTLVVMSLIITCVLQIRIWHDLGIF